MIKKCPVCLKEFKIFPSRYSIRKYCSIKCKYTQVGFQKENKYGSFNKGRKAPWVIERNKNLKIRKHLSNIFKGSGHPNWRGGKSRCIVCNKQLFHYNKKYCREHSPFIRRGKNHPNWKGGISGERSREHNTSKYKNWRKSIFERDNYTCQKCEQYGEKLNVDHIKPWVLYPALRYNIDNGRTLCINCHREIGWKGSHLTKRIYDG